ncbi:UNKNOWN [Stylonychia lemnae]|uniref:Uncharacterized protein n=1 Tax=Stylonychia lemnae TaxID=5949 RepID=A0A078A460_STYLE|nr:UNKNOWN [Stylonychia lemnae]|eukprot:CDW77048.1 UNKNOWN [Stylonychia lemnae]
MNFDVDSMEECLASKISRHQFRDRDKQKEMSDKEFKISNFETTVERIERIQDENQKAFLLGKYIKKDSGFDLRKDDKTITDLRGIQHQARNELERIKDIIKSRRKFDREGFNLDILNSTNIFRQNDPVPQQTIIKNKNYFARASLSQVADSLQLDIDKIVQKQEPYYQHDFKQDLSQRISPKLSQSYQVIDQLSETQAINKSILLNKAAINMKYSKLFLPRNTANNTPRYEPIVENTMIITDTTKFSNRNYESFDKYQQLTQLAQEKIVYQPSLASKDSIVATNSSLSPRENRDSKQQQQRPIRKSNLRNHKLQKSVQLPKSKNNLIRPSVRYNESSMNLSDISKINSGMDVSKLSNQEANAYIKIEQQDEKPKKSPSPQLSKNFFDHNKLYLKPLQHQVMPNPSPRSSFRILMPSKI